MQKRIIVRWLFRVATYLPLAYLLILVFDKAKLMNNGIADTIAFVTFEIILVCFMVVHFEATLSGKKLSVFLREITTKIGITRPR